MSNGNRAIFLRALWELSKSLSFSSSLSLSLLSPDQQGTLTTRLGMAGHFIKHSTKTPLKRHLNPKSHLPAPHGAFVDH